MAIEIKIAKARVTPVDESQTQLSNSNSGSDSDSDSVSHLDSDVERVLKLKPHTENEHNNLKLINCQLGWARQFAEWMLAAIDTTCPFLVPLSRAAHRLRLMRWMRFSWLQRKAWPTLDTLGWGPKLQLLIEIFSVAPNHTLILWVGQGRARVRSRSRQLSWHDRRGQSATITEHKIDFYALFSSDRESLIIMG